MANIENLTSFTATNQPTNRRSRAGVPNRNQIAKQIVEAKIVTKNPLTGERETLSFTRLLALEVIAELGRSQ